MSKGNKDEEKEKEELKHEEISKLELESSREEVFTCKSFGVEEKTSDERGNNGLDPREVLESSNE